jgi:hypothetical protein
MTETTISPGRQFDIMSMALSKKACQSPQFKRTWARSVKDYVVYCTAVSQAKLDAAIDVVVSQEIELESLLLDRCHVSREELGAALSRHYHCPFLSSDELTIIESGLLKNLSLDYLKKHAWIPLSRHGATVESRHVFSSSRG